jgi:hypothetical protein
MRIWRLTLAVVGLMVPVVALAPAGAAPAWALTTGSGLVQCTAATGSVKYTPAWKDSNSNSQIKAKIKFTFTDCSGGSPTPAMIKGSGTLKFVPSQSDNMCTGAEEPGANGQIKLTYGGGIAPSKIIGDIWVPSPSSALQIETGNTYVTGSYPVPYHGDLVPTLSINAQSVTGNCTSGVSKVILGGGIAYQI